MLACGSALAREAMAGLSRPPARLSSQPCRAAEAHPRSLPGLGRVPPPLLQCASFAAHARLVVRLASQRNPPWRTHAQQDAERESDEGSAEHRRRGERAAEAAATVG